MAWAKTLVLRFRTVRRLRLLQHFKFRKTLWSLVGVLALAGCDLAPPVPAAKPQARPSGLVPPSQEAEGPSKASEALTRFYARLQNDLIAQDLMRQGGGGVDTPFTESDLLRNFERIAFFNEYARNGGLRPSDGTPGRLKKWTVPVRIGIEFGDNVPMENRARDSENLVKYVARLSRITGHPISVTNTNPNFVVMIMNNDDAAQAQARATQLVPSIKDSNLVFFSNLPRSIQCFVIAAGFENEHEYRAAVAYIRSENTALQRLACIHEEVAQGLGLANDSPRARPSIFNDDEEFALLTTHDEMLLRALYDPALRPGMSLEEARPILRDLFARSRGAS